jgi:hypothetical protein
VLQVEKVTEEDAQTPNLNVKVSVSFPQSEIFGIKLINGHATEARLSVSNNEPTPIGVSIVGGSLSLEQAGESRIVRNLTSKKYSIEIPAGAEETVPYTFTTDLHPQDLRLQLVAVLKDNKNSFYTVPVYNETVTVVEAATSFFDPQMYVPNSAPHTANATSPLFLYSPRSLLLPAPCCSQSNTRLSSIFLYLVVLGVFGGISYFVYNTWITTFFPQKKGRGKGGERAKKSSLGSKKVDPADQVAVVGADGPAVTSGAKAYDESWIPASHLQRPEAKRIRSGTPKTKPKV